MQPKTRGLRFACTLLAAGLATLALSACGSSSGDAASLLKQTFSGAHTVNSGNLSFNVAVNPSGSTTLNGPIGLSFGGPFQTLGKGKLPASNFNISINALGKTGSIAILSTGTNGYVTLQGNSYQLPQATFQRLESSFAQATNSSSGQSGLSKLGIDPLHWLNSPTIVGKESVGGAQTTHIRARVNVAALLTDLNTFLMKASSLGSGTAGKIPSTIPDSTRAQIVSQVRNPSFDVWTGNSDKTVRKLAINLTIPVTGQISTALGGLRSAQVGISMEYANLNQPQTISAPTTVRPFTEFATKLRGFLTSVQSGVAGATGATGAAGATGGSPAPTAPTGTTGATGGTSGATVQNYSQCIKAAGQDVAKMQQCASLINGR